MDKPRVSIIVAMDEKRGIGKDNDLLFRIPTDGKRVRMLTTGHPLVMGRKTFESLGKLLPNRTHIVVTRNLESLKHLSYQPNEVVSSVEEGIAVAESYPGADEIFIFGGGQIYAEAMKKGLVDRLYLTVVKGDYDADTFFPDYNAFGFTKILKEESHESGGYQYAFLNLIK